ncbi:DUF397 domain-containing protein [Streptomyces sp. HB132]|uniref:DUF397 domain-containing protein n=1 Tax=Streptomyces sp. HB132 TaxID=767388 RepID=UPI00195F4400|nr:DUF397 domain-containing protein [Streptomyces sp. HB132]MBM7439024.1 hypothetical protein [Streptomyces sp. HB132]
MTEHIAPDASVPTRWRKSSYSDNQGGSCLEALDGHPTGIPVRDSKALRGPTLLIPASGWSSFVSAVKAGHLSL